MGDLEAAEGHAAEMVAYCAAKKVEFFGLIAAHQKAFVHAMRNPTRENILACREWFEAQRRIGMRLAHYIYLGALAEAVLSAGDIEGAETLLQEAFALAEETGERAYLSMLHRVDGQIALKRSQPDRARAESCFLRAFDIAHTQEARMYELAATCELARLQSDAYPDSNPRALLAPVLAAIQGGATIPVVQGARTLLMQLA
jgi:predicted ATPase